MSAATMTLEAEGEEHTRSNATLATYTAPSDQIAWWGDEGEGVGQEGQEQWWSAAVAIGAPGGVDINIDSTNPFDGEYDHTWPAGEQWADNYAEEYQAEQQGGGTVAVVRDGTGNGEGGGWTQQWDETSQNYYWYNAWTGESRW